MRRDPRKLLEDIRQATAYLQDFTAGVNADSYSSNKLLQSAVERQLEIAAEAVNRLLKASPDLVERITEYRKVIDFRNVLSHGYDVVKPSIVWGVVQKDVSILRHEVEVLLAELGDA